MISCYVCYVKITLIRILSKKRLCFCFGVRHVDEVSFAKASSELTVHGLQFKKKMVIFTAGK
jgi:hypothetical protein